MRLALLLLLVAAPSAAASPPSISVGTLFDYLPAQSSNLLKRIRNTGDSTAYVRVEVARIQFDADGKASETPVDNAALVRSVAGAKGIIASPSRLIIPAHGQQATRLVHRGQRDQERYYRLRFIPVVPNAAEFSLSEEQARMAAEMTSAIRVFTGFGTVLIVPPQHPQYDTRLHDGRIENHGNATVVLDNLRQCERAQADTCTPGPLIHIRPGRSHVLDIPGTHFVRYELREGEARRSIDSRR